MRTTRPLYDRRSNPLGIGPELAFAAAILAGLVAWIGLTMTLAADLVVPMVATLLLVFAAALAAVAWRRGGENQSRVTYADVAGALTFIGICVAATIEREQLVRIVASGPIQP